MSLKVALAWPSRLSIERFKFVHFDSLARQFRFAPPFPESASARTLLNPADEVAEEPGALVDPGVDEQPGDAFVDPFHQLLKKILSIQFSLFSNIYLHLKKHKKILSLTKRKTSCHLFFLAKTNSNLVSGIVFAFQLNM